MKSSAGDLSELLLGKSSINMQVKMCMSSSAHNNECVVYDSIARALLDYDYCLG